MQNNRVYISLAVILSTVELFLSGGINIAPIVCAIYNVAFMSVKIIVPVKNNET